MVVSFRPCQWGLKEGSVNIITRREDMVAERMSFPTSYYIMCANTFYFSFPFDCIACLKNSPLSVRV